MKKELEELWGSLRGKGAEGWEGPILPEEFLREELEGIFLTMMRVVKEAENRKSKGQIVPYHGPFCAVAHFPSVVHDCEEIAKSIQRRLAKYDEWEKQVDVG